MNANLQPHQQRVVIEKSEIDNRISKLVDFFETDIFSTLDDQEQGRLKRQAVIMKDYSDVLQERIDSF